ncbi:MAG: large conductance mechanosensitive channel protein MscL [Anaerolineales bacterium]|nr:MAG: large conductance mechanosensitive channel protein MscL [Anaerolineales bacterium]
MLKEFKEFATRGNAVDLAVGLILGTAFTGIVNTLVNGVLMPPLGLLLGGADFKDLYVLLQPGDPAGPYASLEAAQAAGAVTLNYGEFANALIHFLIVAVALFFLVRGLNRLYSMGRSAPMPAKGKTAKKK